LEGQRLQNIVEVEMVVHELLQMQVPDLPNKRTSHASVR